MRPLPLKCIACGAAVIAAAVALPSPAVAADPVGDCPPPFELFAVPDDGSRPVAALIDATGNRDGYVCQLPFPGAAASHVGAPYNIIENRLAAGS